ncbi:recombinase family protein [Tabrizicola oligotrophica]|uniref:Recombinase family protein n=1 Tax=Tabrizicola oligotrophica TaxID=2710650 RepID=A0A6M0QZI7_9RHOB|nr:recombinase family protein [Tabrizicola oligotrophica]NEY92284.1 recombinase family protein [Tabrizicola oligotrophica]
MNAPSRTSARPQTLRCAIYTRKSSDEGLEQGFNSLDAQHEACAAYVASQRHEGWKLLPDRFDDGGLSGGTLERPALQRLLAEVDAGRVGMIVVYKIDRLTRSLADFARLVERLERKGCSFVSVTQAFNTSSSMGRLTLNVLLSFAQFEREVTAERIRDKVAASKRKGLWMGGSLPLGYDPPKDPLKARVLAINSEEAKTVQALFDLYLKTGTLMATRDAALAAGLSPRKADHSADARAAAATPAPFSYGQLHYLLTNPVYRGLIRHKALVHPGQHAPIIDAATWEAVQAKLQDGAARKRQKRATTIAASATQEAAADQSKPGLEPVAPLATKLFDETGDRLTPSHTNRHNRRFRYYVSRRLITMGRDPSGWRLPAPQLEALLLAALRDHLRSRAQAHDVMVTPEAGTAQQLCKAVADLADHPDPGQLWPLIETIHLEPGRLRIALDRGEIARRLGLQIEQLSPALTGFEQPFTQRRRGVETRLISGNTLPRPDPTLQQNLARAHAWAKALRSGQSLAQIASSESRSESAIRSRLTLAFLAPQIQRAILKGTLGPQWSTDAILRLNLPADWAQQIKALGL